MVKKRKRQSSQSQPPKPPPHRPQINRVPLASAAFIHYMDEFIEKNGGKDTDEVGHTACLEWENMPKEGKQQYLDKFNQQKTDFENHQSDKVQLQNDRDAFRVYGEELKRTKHYTEVDKAHDKVFALE